MTDKKTPENIVALGKSRLMASAKPPSLIIPFPQAKQADGSSWTSAVDMLRALADDIEKGECKLPDICYVAMCSRHPTQPLVAFPSYFWASRDLDTLAVSGMLAHHVT